LHIAILADFGAVPSPVSCGSGNDRERHILAEIPAREQVFMNSTNPAKIQAAITDLRRVRWPILMRTPSFLTGMFKHFADHRASMNDQPQARHLMPAEEQASEELGGYTGRRVFFSSGAPLTLPGMTSTKGQ
jgi:hypothetical protein